MSSETASTSNPLVLIVGRLSGPKNEVILRILREVAPRVTEQVPGVKFLVLGGPVTEVHRQMESAQTNVSFEGHQPDLKPYYEKASVVVGAGRVALEAMALHRPVVAIGERKYIGPLLDDRFAEAKATNFGDCSEDTEFDLERMTKDLTALLQDPRLRVETAQSGFKLLSDEYNMTTIYPKVERIYQEVILRKNLSSVGELPVLMYHRVVDGEPATSKYNIHITGENLEKHLLFLKVRKFTTVTFSDILEKRLPKKPVILTFDDGYEDNYHHLLPILRKYDMKAVVYLVGDRKNNNHWDMRNGEPEVPLMSDEQIKAMAASGLVEFGAHSMSHSRLVDLPLVEIEREIQESKKAIEALVGKPAVSFAYPYGNLNEEVKRVTAEAGFRFGIAVNDGPWRFGGDPMAIRRVHIFPTTGVFDLFKKTSGFYFRYRLPLQRLKDLLRGRHGR